MLLFLFLLVAGQASAEGGGQVLEIKNSKGETFSYKDRVAQEKEVFDIKDRFVIKSKYTFSSNRSKPIQIDAEKALAIWPSASV